MLAKILFIVALVMESSIFAVIVYTVKTTNIDNWDPSFLLKAQSVPFILFFAAAVAKYIF